MLVIVGATRHLAESQGADEEIDLALGERVAKLAPVDGPGTLGEASTRERLRTALARGDEVAPNVEDLLEQRRLHPPRPKTTVRRRAWRGAHLCHQWQRRDMPGFARW